jgi:hypothetical protein
MTSISVKSSSSEPESIEHLNPVAARMMLAAFPTHVREAFERRAMGVCFGCCNLKAVQCSK